MKKYLVVFILLFTNLASYGSYFSLTEKETNKVLYGKFTTKDFVSGNIYLQDSSAETICNGFGFALTPDTAKSFKNVNSFAKIACNNGMLLEISWNSLLIGNAIDQYQNKYTLNGIKRKEYKHNIKKRVKIKNEDKL